MLILLHNSEKAELTALIRNTERFSKSGISIYDSAVPQKMDRKIQATAKRYQLQANAITTKLLFPVIDFLVKLFL